MPVTGYFEYFPQRENGENLAYFEPAGNRNCIAATQAWIEEKQLYHGQALTAKPRYETEGDKQKQWAITRRLSGQKWLGWAWDSLMSRTIVNGSLRAGRILLLGTT